MFIYWNIDLYFSFYNNRINSRVLWNYNRGLLKEALLPWYQIYKKD